MRNPLQSKSLSWLARSLAALGVTLGLALACSGGKELPPLAAAGGGTAIGAIGGGGLKSGPCNAGDTASCSMTLSRHNGVLSCYHGTQTCVGGQWSGCSDGEVTYQPDVGTGSSTPGTRSQSLSTPTACLTNPCDPTCQVFNEVPDGSLVAEAGVRWPWTGGTLGGVASPSPGLNQPCKTANDCQFNTYCSNVATDPACSHDKCSTGAALAGNCDSCVSDVCAADTTCCSGCKPGEILSSSGQHCYYVGTSNVTWPDARTACQSRGSGWDLTSISDLNENNFIWAKVGLYAWIGLNDQAVEGNWQWADGEAVPFVHWDTAAGQPNGGTAENCVRMNNYGLWHDWPCTNSTGPYICEGPSSLTNACTHALCATGGALSSSCDACAASICAIRPSCCSTAWDSQCVSMVQSTCNKTCPCGAGETLSFDNQSCYYKTPSGSTWVTAQTTCRNHGTGWDLVKITSPAENAQIESMISGDTWTGLNDRATEGTYLWSSDGSALGSYAPWDSNQPNNNGDQDCIEIHTNGSWNDETCSNSQVAICEGPAAGSGPTWSQHCVDLVSSTCDVTCGNASGMCLPWTPGMTNSACTGVDLTVGPPCDGNVPICNHGTSQAPAGISVVNLPTGSGKFGTCNPDLSSVTGVQTCTTTAPIPPGQCINLTGCAGLTTTRDIVVNPTGAQAECSCRDNWATYTPGTTCAAPLCEDITRGATGTNTKLDLYVLVSTEGAMYNPWWTSPTPAYSALTEFFQSANNAGVAVDLNLINGPPGGGCGDNGTCNAANCGAADVPLGTLTAASAPTDTQEAALIAGLGSVTTSQWSQAWSLSTALQGTIDRARAHQAANPNEAHAVVLIGADIWGNACSTTLAMAESAAATGLANGVKTYAIDVADWSISNYDAIASSGGTTSAFRGYNLSNPSDLTSMKAPIRAALDSIVASNATAGGTTSIACSYPTGSRPLDTTNAQVTWSANGTTTSLAQVAGSGSCSNGGYYYDNASTPTSITLCPSTCSAIQTTTGARLNIEIPCPPVYTNRVTRQIYQAQCPTGSAPQWSLFSYDATTPEDSSITMTFRTALTSADLTNTPMTPLATASATSATGQVCAMCGVGCGSSSSCPIDLFSKLNGLPAARLPVLELVLTLNPSTTSQLSPILNSWKVTYSCPPAE